MWMPFISFSCLISLASISSKMINSSSDSWHPYLIFDLRKKAFSLSPLNMALFICGIFIDALYLSDWGSSLLFLLCSQLLSWKSAGFCQMPFLHQLRWSCVFVLHSIKMVYYIDFQILNQIWIYSRDKHRFLVVYPFSPWLDSVW